MTHINLINLTQEAIQKALDCNWKESIALNEQIVSEDANNVDALNRLAKAYFELGKCQKAKVISKQVLKIDPFNTIASKNINKWNIAKTSAVQISSVKIRPDTFLEEPGKTKILNLLNIGSEKTILSLDAGDEVKISSSSHKVTICTKDGKYLGKLPDDISARLKTLIKNGYVYKACVKSASNKEIKVFIREVCRGPKNSDTPSFTSEKIDYVSFTPPELVHKKESDVEGEENTVEETSVDSSETSREDTAI